MKQNLTCGLAMLSLSPFLDPPARLMLIELVKPFAIPFRSYGHLQLTFTTTRVLLAYVVH